MPVASFEKHSLGTRHAVPASLYHAFVGAILDSADVQGVHSQSQAGHWAIRALVRALESAARQSTTPRARDEQGQEGDHSSFHSRRYTASASPVWATCSRLAISQASILILLHRSSLSVVTYSSSRRQIFVRSLPRPIRVSAADTSRFTGPFLDSRCVWRVSFIRCRDSTGKSLPSISGSIVPGIGTFGGIPAEAVCSAFGAAFCSSSAVPAFCRSFTGAGKMPSAAWIC